MKSCGFSRRERLTAKKDFEVVFKKGKKVKSSAFFYAYAVKKHKNPARLGISVSKKIGNAVVRNRVKRRFREIFRKNKGVVKKGVDIVLVAKPGIQHCSFRDIERILLTKTFTYNA